MSCLRISKLPGCEARFSAEAADVQDNYKKIHTCYYFWTMALLIHIGYLTMDIYSIITHVSSVTNLTGKIKHLEFRNKIKIYYFARLLN